MPNRACAEAMLRAAGFAIEAHPEEEVYLCRRRELGPAEAERAVVHDLFLQERKLRDGLWSIADGLKGAPRDLRVHVA